MPDFESYVRERLGLSQLPARREQEIIEEIAGHMTAAFEEALEGGASEEDALVYAESPFVPWDALRREIGRIESSPNPGRGWPLGQRTTSHDPGRSRRGLRQALSNLGQDLRFGLRTLRRRPLFCTVVIATVALGIGTTTTMFSVVDGVLIRPLPFPGSEELVTVAWSSDPGSGWSGALQWPEFMNLREHCNAFQKVAVYRPERLILTGSGDPASLVAGVATASLFPTLGVQARLGRLFQEGEDGPGARRVVVLSGEIWGTRFGSDPDVIGRTITLDDIPYEVIGVLPTGFRLRNRPGGSEIESGVDTGLRDVWLPVGFDGTDVLAVELTYGGREYHVWSRNLELVGRLRPEVSHARARSQVTALLQGESGFSPEVEIELLSVKEEETGTYRFALLFLLGAAAMLLLVACANVANLLMSEATMRRREIGTRIALGASRSRVARLLLVESTLLGLGGSLLGIGLAQVGVRMLVAYGPYLPGLEDIRVDHRILLFAISLGILTGMGFGLTPAIRGARLPDLSRWTGSSGRRGRFQHHAVAVVFAVTTVLLVAGGLLARSFWNVAHLDLGFHAENLATIRLPILPDRYEDLDSRDVFLHRVIAGILAIPGVSRASGADNLPFPGARSGHSISLPGGEDGLQTPLRRVLADYHEVMGIPVVAGRGFRDTDVEGQTPVAILSEAAARHFWPGESAIGRLVHHDSYGDLTVVGVVGEVTEGWVQREPRPMIYLPLAQTTQDEITLVARTTVNPASILPQMREAVWAVDPDVAVAMERTMESLVADSNLTERYRTLLVGFFALAASLLAAMGIFGITARSIAMRIRELGIRVALGAPQRTLVGMVLRENLRTAVGGTALGLVGAYWASSLFARLLYQMDPLDPLTFGAVPVTLAGVCLGAAYLATRRILRMDPVTALKVE